MVLFPMCSFVGFQSYCMHHGPANDAIVKMLLDKKANPSIQVASGCQTFITPLHILSSWSPVRLPILGQHGSSNRAVNHNSSSHNKREVEHQLSCLNAVKLAGAELDPMKKPNGVSEASLSKHHASPGSIASMSYLFSACQHCHHCCCECCRRPL